jgi:hypothetical protein
LRGCAQLPKGVGRLLVQCNTEDDISLLAHLPACSGWRWKAVHAALKANVTPHLATNRQVLYLGNGRQEKLRTSILSDKKTLIGWVCFCGPWAS